ncbi:uncharacterized protein C6orf62 homolog [Tubulanus polymorphus]|uniref:uncharacterized protein C6orf62 homolog n=1 Tax=Tubulanus polymorphus TaxID=672921 RepID=UPI003DA22D70
MSDPRSRKSNAVQRLRQQLRKKRESLADQFDYKMYTIFHFKDKKKSPAVFEMAEVVNVMTNNYEDTILKGVKEEAYSYESSVELLQKDVVQLHAHRWHPMRKDVIGCTSTIDFFLWPRGDIDHVECLLFSRWKGESEEPFRRLQVVFEFHSDDYEKQIIRLLTQKEKSGLIINNVLQSIFFFMERCTMKTSKNTAVVFKLTSICLYLPQDQLTLWGPSTMEDEMAAYV